jgi:DMSO reductase anchor subunit
MHPAYSVIIFTTASGAGYGLLALASALALSGHIETTRWLGFTIFAVAFGLITLGLLSSTFHLGRPERAWRAFSQWRSSWLSREGVLAAFTYIPAGLFAIGWVIFETPQSPWRIAGWIAVPCAIMTVWSTGMIYASLKTIRQWHNPLVAPVYVVIALATGAVSLQLLLQIFAQPSQLTGWIAISGLCAGLLMKVLYWRRIDTEPKTRTAEQATGLGEYGAVRSLDLPHTQPNYVMREMGYQVARRHGMRLRYFAVLFGFMIPVAATLLAITSTAGLPIVWTALALLSTSLGMFIERWLFFAEAQHVVTLYYGARTA